MIKIYTSPSCLSCRKVKQYFKKHHIDYIETNIINNKLKREDIFKMLVNSENGFEDIISVRSKAFTEATVDFDDMTINEMIDFIIDNPTILKRPIIVTDKSLQVGYNDDDITMFLPPELRHCAFAECDEPVQDCDYVRHIKID